MSGLDKWPTTATRKLSTDQINTIRELWTTTQEENPTITRTEFARRVAPEYSVTARMIRYYLEDL